MSRETAHVPPERWKVRPERCGAHRVCAWVWVICTRPVTRAYSEPEIISVKIAPGDIKDDAAEFALIVRCKRAGWDGSAPLPKGPT